jgi:glutamate/tyrosine decarboxylase-like PLP-dependent enzyme
VFNTGAIDDLAAVRIVCQRYEQWFHVDRCIGALIKIAPGNHDQGRTRVGAGNPNNIVCFRHRGYGGAEELMKDINTEIMLRIHESGAAMISDTTVRNRHWLWVAINNHRTRQEDLNLLITKVVRHGRDIGRNRRGD